MVMGWLRPAVVGSILVGAAMFAPFGAIQALADGRTFGEKCSAFYPCADGLRCAFPAFKCFPSSGEAATTEHCRWWYNADLKRNAELLGQIHTIGHSEGFTAGLATRIVEFGVAYGPGAGQFGCYETTCEGGEADLNAGVNFTNGIFGSSHWGDLAGNSSVATQGLDILIGGVSTSEVFADGVGYIGQVVSIGAGIDLNPVHIGGYRCSTKMTDLTDYITKAKPWPKMGSSSGPANTFSPAEMVAFDVTGQALRPLTCRAADTALDLAFKELRWSDQDEGFYPERAVHLPGGKLIGLRGGEVWQSSEAGADAVRISNGLRATEIGVFTQPPPPSGQVWFALAATDQGDTVLHMSSDQGHNWEAIKGGDGVKFGFGALPAHLAKLDDQGRVVESNDRGKTWSLVSGKMHDLAVFNTGFSALAFLTDNGRLFVTHAAASGYQALGEFDGSVYYAGVNFDSYRNGQPKLRFKSIAANGSQLWALSEDNQLFFVDNPQNAIWRKVNCGAAAKFERIAISVGTLWAVDRDQNLWRATDQGLNWVKINAGLGGLRIIGLTASEGSVFVTAASGGSRYLYQFNEFAHARDMLVNKREEYVASIPPPGTPQLAGKGKRLMKRYGGPNDGFCLTTAKPGFANGTPIRQASCARDLGGESGWVVDTAKNLIRSAQRPDKCLMVQPHYNDGKRESWLPFGGVKPQYSYYSRLVLWSCDDGRGPHGDLLAHWRWSKTGQRLESVDDKQYCLSGADWYHTTDGLSDAYAEPCTRNSNGSFFYYTEAVTNRVAIWLETK